MLNRESLRLLLLGAIFLVKLLMSFPAGTISALQQNLVLSLPTRAVRDPEGQSQCFQHTRLDCRPDTPSQLVGRRGRLVRLAANANVA